MLNLIKKVIRPVCVPGNEGKVADVIAEEIAPYVTSCSRDNMGNLIAFVEGCGENKKKVMFAAHIDEIGFIVTHIEDSGYIRFSTLGGINMTAAAYSQVEFETGVVGVLVPDSGAQNPLNADNCSVDIGAKNRRDAERRVRIGDTFAVKSEAVKLAGSRVAGRPMDDRIGAVVMIEAMKRIEKPYNDVYFCFTTQEEVGCRGSKTASYAVMPDIGIALDVTATGDTLSAKPMEVKLGGGAAIKIKDSSVVCDRALVQKMRSAAEENKIKFQLEILTGGGTDTSSMQQTGKGAIAGCISIPTRYIHSPVETIDLGDVEECVKLTAVLCGTDFSDICG
ncbi:MAG: M42 family metallopeptidase [Eubacteriales bacterium]